MELDSHVDIHFLITQNFLRERGTDICCLGSYTAHYVTLGCRNNCIEMGPNNSPTYEPT